jgi:aminoglycoside 3-N-acetyltransferase
MSGPSTHTTRATLARDLRDLGLRRGAIVMVHAGLRAVGPVVGGPDQVIGALLDALGPQGTIMVYAGWEEMPYDYDSWDARQQRLWREEAPPFDPATSRAQRGHGALVELLRTTPGARRSDHAEASIAAVGAQAEWITANHPQRYGYGEGSPLHRLVQAQGQVLMLGAPLDKVTLLHHAEHVAAVPDKKHERFGVPLLRDGQRVWGEILQYDTSDGIVDAPYTLEQIAGDALTAGIGCRGRVGRATCHLFDAAPLARFAVDWLESRFGGG